MNRFFLLFIIVFVAAPAAISQQNAKTYALKNGNWYNGTTFSPGDWYIQKGVFTQKMPAKIDSTLDLGGQWIIPPMGDVYCANITDSPLAAEMIGRYWDEGVFYLQVPQNTQKGRAETSRRVNRAGAPDAVFANGALTGPYGHPFMELEGPANKLYDPKQWDARFDTLKVRKKGLGDAYWFMSDKTSLSENWKKYMAQKPDVAFIQLLDAANSGGKEKTGGLTPEMAKAVVKKAHKSKLRVFANVKTAEDVRLGLQIGVDGIVNLPGNNWDGVSDLKPFELGDADIEALAKAKTVVAPLFYKGQSATAREAVSGFHQSSLRRLLEKGVHVAIGSDDIQRTIRPELNYWVTTLATDLQAPQTPTAACGCFYKKGEDEKMALRILCEYTPQAIFPKRKIGKIAEGYEASFLVLSSNPIDNILKTRAIAFKVKNGVFYSK
jgi:Amidohydrolase family